VEGDARLGSLDGEPKSSGVESNGGAGGVAGRAARFVGDAGADAGADAGSTTGHGDGVVASVTAGDANPAGGTSPSVSGLSSGATTLIPSLCSLRKSNDDDSAVPGSSPVARARLRLEVRFAVLDTLEFATGRTGSAALSGLPIAEGCDERTRGSKISAERRTRERGDRSCRAVAPPEVFLWGRGPVREEERCQNLPTVSTDYLNIL
jgi:hypothetical protein